MRYFLDKKLYISRCSLLLSLTFLSACSSGPDLADDLIEYQRQWQKELNLRPADVLAQPRYEALTYPSRRELTIEPPDSDISIRKFFQLSHCELNRIVAEHNSILNKHQGPSENLFYDLIFITHTQKCVDGAKEPEREIYQQLIKVSEQKEKRLDQRLFNATFASTEFQKFFSPFAGIPRSSKVDSFNDALQPIPYFLTVENFLPNYAYTVTKYREERKQFDLALRDLTEQQVAGQVLMTADFSTQVLSYINSKITSIENIASKCVRADNRVIPVLDKLKILAKNIQSLYPITNGDSEEQREFTQGYWQAHWSPDHLSTITRFINALDHHKKLIIQLEKNCKNS